MLTIPFLIMGFVLTSGSTVSAESWTDLRGRKTIQAEMLGLWGDTVVLLRPDGRRIGVKLLSLRGESRIQAQQLAEKLAERQSNVTKELRQLRAIAAAPAPDPLPLPPPVSPYQTPQADAELKVQLQQIEQAIRNGHVLALYESLPPSYRKDVDEIVRLVAKKLDRDNFYSVTNTMHRLGNVMVTKQHWMMSSPRLANLDETTLGTVRESLLLVADFVRIGLQDEAIKLEDLQTKPFGEWLKEWDDRIAPYLAQMISLGNIPDINSKITTETNEEGTAVLKSDFLPGLSQTYKKVEGYWVQTDQVDQWSASVEAAKAAISELPEGSTLESVSKAMLILAEALPPLENAASADEFHQSFESLIAAGGRAVANLLASFDLGTVLPAFELGTNDSF